MPSSLRALRACIRALTILVVPVAALAAAPAAPAHQGNPNMESIIRAVTPRTTGLSLRVLNRDDRFELTNRSGKTVLIYGYSGEPYARLLPDGTVEQNTSSPAYYLNQDRYANAAVPAGVTSSSPVTWKVLDKTGSFQWHDHRMHFMGTGTPSQVKDPKKRQKIVDYSVPIKVGTRRGEIAGTQMWTPEPGGGPPVAAIAAFVVLVGLGGGAVMLGRRNRRRGRPEAAGGAPPGSDSPEAPPASREVW
jgi:hypothetical protein